MSRSLSAVREQPEQRHAALEQLQQRVELGDVLEAVVGHQPRRAVEVQRGVGGPGQLGEGGREPSRNARSVGGSVGSASLRAQRAGAEADPDEPLVEVGARPVREPRVDRAPEAEDPLGDAAGGGDDHDHQHLGLEHQDLDVADRGGLDRRRGDDREQVGDLGERLGGHAHRLVDLAPHQLQAQVGGRRQRALGQQPVDVVAVAGVGRRAAGRGVRVREQAELLEHGELVADRRGPAGDVGIGGEGLRSDGLPGRRVALDDLAQQELLAGRQHPKESTSAQLRPCRP